MHRKSKPLGVSLKEENGGHFVEKNRKNVSRNKIKIEDSESCNLIERMNTQHRRGKNKLPLGKEIIYFSLFHKISIKIYPFVVLTNDFSTKKNYLF